MSCNIPHFSLLNVYSSNRLFIGDLQWAGDVTQEKCLSYWSLKHSMHVGEHCDTSRCTTEAQSRDKYRKELQGLARGSSSKEVGET